MTLNFENLICKKDDLFCLNDIASKLIESTNVKEYMKKIIGKKSINGNYYVTKELMVDLLNKSKNIKAHQYFKTINIIKDNTKIIIKNTDKHITTQEQLIEKTNNRQFIDFGSNEIIYDSRKILFFEFNDTIYFKAKDVCELLCYNNISKTITDHVHERQTFSFGGEGVYNGDPHSPRDVKAQQITKLKSTLELKNNIYIEPNTIFISEPGLYRLIMRSKMPKAEEFTDWVTEILVTIRKTGSYNTVKNGKIFDEHKLKELEDKSCLYIIKIKNSIYKYGESDNIRNRLNNHKNNFNFEEIVDIFELPNKTISRETESKIKEFTKNAKINIIYNTSVEFFEGNSNYTIDRVLMEIKNIVDNQLEIYKTKQKNQNLATIENIELYKIRQYEIESNKQIELAKINKEIELAREKTRHLELELELEKIKNSKNNQTINIINNIKEQTNKPNKEADKELKINIRPKVKKCKNCPTMISNKSTNCTPCVNKLRSIKSIEETNRPSYEQIKQDLKDLGSIVQVGCKYKVSDNAVRKWLKRYEIINN